jgi:Na+/proline symporter/nitrogen-specific signal transduction histidine kinase
MLSVDLLLAACIAYVALLFGVAFWADRRMRRPGGDWLTSPVVYTLSISVYCTSWTFYGAVGAAVRGGLEFVAIYTGPMLVFAGWWFLLRKLVRIGRGQRITSIADLLSSRYGKSPTIAVLVTLLAVVGVTPYIALQLKAVTESFAVIGGPGFAEGPATPFWVAAGMAAFTILFGTRSVDVNERHFGVVAAIAVEALVKLLALTAVGAFVVWSLYGGAGAMLADMTPELLRVEDVFGPRWAVMTLLSAAAIICLPRQFQVTVVENDNDRQLATAAWLFPLYLLVMCLSVLPIAAAGLRILPEGANPDMFVLSLPLAQDRTALALLVFLGGFSSATSMVIVACIALSTMVSNHIITPLALRARADLEASTGDVRRILLVGRRGAILALMLLGFLYHQGSEGNSALSAIGLIAFAGVAQFLPPLVAGLYWRQATRLGAVWGLSAGAAVWAWTLLLPAAGLPQAVLAEGPWGLSLLRPQALLGLEGMDPLVHAVFWSLFANTALLVAVSLWREPSPLEWLQSALFVDVFRTGEAETAGIVRRSAASEDLYVLAQRILGAGPAQRLFREAALEQGREGLPAPSDHFVQKLERELAGSVGAASAHAMVTNAAGGETISLTELMRIADETVQLMEYSAEAERKSRELERTAAQLREANARLRELDAQKDDFLSQVSHELRTPMTSVRSFAEILLETRDVDSEEARRFLRIIFDESQRLTRLLDQILDLNVLERGEVALPVEPTDAAEALRRAVETVRGFARETGARIELGRLPAAAPVLAEPDRLAQVFINLLSNAVKYNDAPEPEVRVSGRIEDGQAVFSVEDNGPGVAPRDRERIFLKFSRGWDRKDTGGAGLGLAISREITRRFGGDLALVGAPRGARFEVRLPLREARAAAE